jgi:hypothetical protein
LTAGHLKYTGTLLDGNFTPEAIRRSRIARLCESAFLQKSLKKKVNKTSYQTDIETVGIIVPLPNHYNSDMPQGHGAAWIAIFKQLFFLFYRLKQ